MNSYRTADGRWLFFTGLEADRHIGPVCRALGRPDLLEDPRFANAGALRKNRAEVIAVLDEMVAQQPLDVWAERFDAEGVWWAPAQGPAQVLADGQLAATHGFVDVQGAEGTATGRAVNGPVTFSGAPRQNVPPAPRLGEHTEEVLAELQRRKGAGV
jgi:crotonobetainyl-CoA:carnitine CoA-transferase CaiB-like acyl-CoA transferase